MKLKTLAYQKITVGTPKGYDTPFAIMNEKTWTYLKQECKIRATAYSFTFPTYVDGNVILRGNMLAQRMQDGSEIDLDLEDLANIDDSLMISPFKECAGEKLSWLFDRIIKRGNATFNALPFGGMMRSAYKTRLAMQTR